MISITDGLQAIYNSNIKEKTALELEREVRQLTNNWNELEEWISKQEDSVVEINAEEQKKINK